MCTHSYRRAYIGTHVTTYERKENRKTICPPVSSDAGAKKKKKKKKKEKSNVGENLEYMEFSRI